VNTIKKCNRCKGLGKIPTIGEVVVKYYGVDMSGPKFVVCPRCFGKGIK